MIDMFYEHEKEEVKTVTSIISKVLKVLVFSQVELDLCDYCLKEVLVFKI